VIIFLIFVDYDLYLFYYLLLILSWQRNNWFLYFE